MKKQLLLQRVRKNSVFHVGYLKSRPAFAGLLFALLAVLALTGCALANQSNAALGQQFNIRVNQTVVITGENIRIKFLDISDSRCPTGATCIWAGEARATVQINGDTDNLTLVQPGYSTDNAYLLDSNHLLQFQVKPYPAVNQTIAKSEYRLVITVNKYSQHSP